MVSKLEYVRGLSDDELRYEIDKVYARLKEIDMLRQVQEGLPVDFLNPSLNLLVSDFELLQLELDLFQMVYDERME